VKPSLTAGTPPLISKLECAKHSAVISHVTLDAMAIRERWPDGIPEKMMKMWGLAAATHNNSKVSPSPGEPPHIFQNPMNHHHVLIYGGHVYLSQETARFASLHLPALLDLLEAASHVEDVEFILNFGDTHDFNDEKLLQAERIPLLSYSKVEQAHEFDLLVPCCYDPMIDHLCNARGGFPPFLSREPIAFGSYAERCPIPTQRAPPLRDFDGRVLPKCPRKYYWELAQNNSETLDVRLHGTSRTEEDPSDHYEYVLDAKRATLPDRGKKTPHRGVWHQGRTRHEMGTLRPLRTNSTHKSFAIQVLAGS